MLSFENMKHMSNGITTVGQQLKKMSDDVMQATWGNDIQTRTCYIYDYLRDDQADQEYGYNPSLSKTKIPVKLKFIVKTYKSMAKDDPEYHIEFEPDVWNSMFEPEWFKMYKSQGIHYPVGLYVDIPDDRGVYYRWIICYHEVANQFPKFGVLRCNYLFKWITNDGVRRIKRKVWGIEATQNSYTSGVWRDNIFSTFDDQGKFLLPWSSIVSELRHDTRIFISMLQPEPLVYKITKVKNTSPKGIVIFTVKQDRYESEHDYVCLDPLHDDYGEMYADYYSSTVQPLEEIKQLVKTNKFVIEAANYKVRLGNSKVIYSKVYDANNVDITKMFANVDCEWTYELLQEVQGKSKLTKLDINVISDSISSVDLYHENDIEKCRFKNKFKFNGDEQYVDCQIKVTCKLEDMSTTALLDIVPL